MFVAEFPVKGWRRTFWLPRNFLMVVLLLHEFLRYIQTATFSYQTWISVFFFDIFLVFTKKNHVPNNRPLPPIVNFSIFFYPGHLYFNPIFIFAILFIVMGLFMWPRLRKTRIMKLPSLLNTVKNLTIHFWKKRRDFFHGISFLRSIRRPRKAWIFSPWVNE